MTTPEDGGDRKGVTPSLIRRLRRISRELDKLLDMDRYPDVDEQYPLTVSREPE